MDKNLSKIEIFSWQDAIIPWCQPLSESWKNEVKQEENYQQAKNVCSLDNLISQHCPFPKHTTLQTLKTSNSKFSTRELFQQLASEKIAGKRINDDSGKHSQPGKAFFRIIEWYSRSKMFTLDHSSSK